MLVKTILNNIEKYKSFVYGGDYFEEYRGEQRIIIELSAGQNSQGECSSWSGY